MKKYIPVKESEKATHLKIELRYNLGGLGFASYTPEPRGYYLHVTPVKRYNRDGVNWEQFTAFTGVKHCVKTVSRKSAKAEADAETAAAQIENNLVSWVLEKNGLELAEGVAI